MYSLAFTGQFKKDLKLLKRRSGVNFQTLLLFVEGLQKDGIDGIDQKYKPHKLKGNYSDCLECHVLNDLLLIWMQDDELKRITLVRTGTHSDLFRK